MTEQKQKKMTFRQAIKEIEAGKKVRRAAWSPYLTAYICLHSEIENRLAQHYVWGGDAGIYLLTIEDIKAKDWIRVEEN